MTAATAEATATAATAPTANPTTGPTTPSTGYPPPSTHRLKLFIITSSLYS